jgi:hypothetical protein
LRVELWDTLWKQHLRHYLKFRGTCIHDDELWFNCLLSMHVANKISIIFLLCVFILYKEGLSAKASHSEVVPCNNSIPYTCMWEVELHESRNFGIGVAHISIIHPNPFHALVHEFHDPAHAQYLASSAPQELDTFHY